MSSLAFTMLTVHPQVKPSTFTHQVYHKLQFISILIPVNYLLIFLLMHCVHIFKVLDVFVDFGSLEESEYIVSPVNPSFVIENLKLESYSKPPLFPPANHLLTSEAWNADANTLTGRHS